MALIDISVTITPALATWKNEDSGIKITWPDQFGVDGSENCTSAVSYGSHLGTHLDAPLHFIEGGGTVEQIAVETLVGPCFVADLSAYGELEISVEALESAAIPKGTKRLLLKTGNSRKRLLDDSRFHDEFVALGPEAARWLVSRDIALVGVDYLSVGSAVTGTGGDVHRILLGAKIVAVEGLDLADVEPGAYDLICLPLRIAGIEGAPVRALLATPGHFSRA